MAETTSRATASSSQGSGAKEQAQEKAQVAQEKVKEGAQQAKGRVSEQVDQRSTQAGQQVRSTGDALRQTAQQLRSEGKDQPAQAAERAASQAEKIGGWLERSSGDDILNDIEDFGRRQPLAVGAAGLALGFAAARFLKASSQQRYSSRYGQGGGYSGADYAGSADYAGRYGRSLPETTTPATSSGTLGDTPDVPLTPDPGSSLSGGVGAVDPSRRAR